MLFGRLVRSAATCAVVAALMIPAARAADVDATDDSPEADDSVALSVEGPLSQPLALPSVLGEADADRYSAIFAAQQDGDWAEADRLIKELTNPLLMGHVLAQRYLHPTAYRSKYSELRDWLARYADHPDAQRIYDLAIRRKPAREKAPVRPVAIDGGPSDPPARTNTQPAIPARPGLANAERQKARGFQHQVQGYLRRGLTLAAKRVIQSEDARKVLSAAELAVLETRLATAYFSDGRDEWAVDWADSAIRHGARYVPDAHWIAGLGAWRLGRLEEAQAHFASAASSRAMSPWLISASAFWASRAYLVGHKPEEVNRWLGVASGYPRTFYGLLARHSLGLPVAFQWETPDMEARDLNHLTGLPVGQRALGLVQVGETARAERELRALAAAADRDTGRGVLALAAQGGMPALAMRLAGQLFPGSGLDGALYPVPPWEPEGGYRVDRALIYALIRQESAFNPNAKSWAGARGLMQLMPGTAGFVAGDRRYRNSKRNELFDPKHNLELGQKYLEMLLDDRNVKGDLFQLAAAWNGGPGNLQRWWRNSKHMNDPLLFIESIPSRETRSFIERVLANLWIYRYRLGQPTPSLDALAAGGWPEYVAQDEGGRQLAESRRGR